MTLGLDADIAPGPQRLVHRCHGADGQFGEYTVMYSDYRAVGGLALPFSERASFNGADELLTRTIDAIAINTPLDPALFEPGTAGGQ